MNGRWNLRFGILASTALLCACNKWSFGQGNDKGADKKSSASVTDPLLATADVPNPEEVYIRSVSYAGSGCAANTVSSNISPDAKALTLLFAEYSAEAGPDVDPAGSRKNCQITLDLHSPAGYSYSLFKLDTRGFAGLDDGVVGEVKSTYYFQGQQISETFSDVISGPSNADYTTTTQANVDDEVWSSCEGASRALNINTEVVVDNAAAPEALGYMTVDSIDGEFTHRYAIKWRACETPTPSPTPTPNPGPSPLTGTTFVAVGSGAGSSEPVRIFDLRNTSAAVASFYPFGVVYTGGTRVALADVDGDGIVDLIAGTEEGQAPRVVVIDGRSQLPILDFAPFTGTGGVYVAAGDTDADGRAEIVVGAGKGVAPEVKVYGRTGILMRTVMVYEPTFLAGVRIAMGDFNGDKTLDIATSTPPGGGPRVKILNGSNLATMADGFVYAPDFRGGVWIAAGDVDGDGKAEVITGADVGGGPHVRVLSVEGFAAKADFFAYDSSLRSGVRVATVDANGDGRSEVLVAPGQGGGPHIRVVDPFTGRDTLGAFFGADPNSRYGFYVSGAVPAAR